MAALLLGAAVTAGDGVEIGPSVFDFLQAPWDLRAASLFDYALGTDLTELVTVPGSGSTNPAAPRPQETILRGRPTLLLLLRRWFDCFLAVHRSGYSLRGNFTAARFVVGVGMQVKISTAGGIHLFRYTPHNATLDYGALATSVEELLLQQEAVPPHIQTWLALIRQGVGSEYLIRYHTALMDPRQALDFVLEGKIVLERLRDVNPDVFDMILTQHAQLQYWNFHSQCVDSYMAAARDFKDPRTGKPYRLAGDLTGVLTLARNCSAHPAIYLKEYMILILEDDFPGLVARFQESLFRAGLLPSFRLELTMA